MEDAKTEFQDIVRKELFGLEWKLVIEVDHHKFLDERVLHDNSMKTI